MSCDMNGPHAGRVVLITGAGGGVGRGYAMLFAMGGAKVMVNDLKKGVSSGAGAVDIGAREGAGQETRLVADGDNVVAEIIALGGIASANYDDVSDWAGAENMINQTIEEFGDINVLICNAGILRDRTM